MRNGFEQAGREIDFVAEELEPLTDTGSELANLLESGPELLITNDAFLDEQQISIAGFAADHPETTFAVVGDADVPGPNVVPVEFIDEEAAFLVGAAAALESRSGVIGFVGADPWTVDAFRAGYEAGARQVRPEITIRSSYLVAEAFVVWDGALASEAAAALFEEGADVVFTVAGEGGRAVATVAAEQSELTGRQLWTVGVDVDEWLLADDATRDHILTSAIRRLDVAVQTVIERFEGDQTTISPVVLGAGNGGVSYSRSGDHLAPETIDVLEQLRADLDDGPIEVPELPLTPPTDPPEPDAVLEVVIDRGRCQANSSSSVGFGGMLQIDAVNQGQSTAGLEVRKATDGATPSDFEQSPGSVVNLGTSPTSRAAVAPTGRHALSARMNQTGTWAVLCVDESGADRSLAALIDVAEAAPADSALPARVVYDGNECGYVGPRELSSGDGVAFTLTNSSDAVAGLSVWRVTDGTKIADVNGIDAMSRASLYLAGSLPNVPIEGTDGLILVLPEAGTYLANCFQPGVLTADRPGAIIVVEP